MIWRLYQKQIDIAKRSGKPVPMYLQEAERNRKYLVAQKNDSHLSELWNVLIIVQSMLELK